MPGFDLSLKTSPCRAVLDYWLASRGDRLRPRRAEIDPLALGRYLPNVGLFEVRSPDLTVCHLAGTAFRTSLGFELTGRNVIHLYGPDLHRAAGYRFLMMATNPCAATFEMLLRFSTGEENPHEILLLPLEPDDGETPPALLVAIAPMERVEWESTAILPQFLESPSFRFVDIGAGVPASWPPDDFNVER
jgi:hypothetical protein